MPIDDALTLADALLGAPGVRLAPLGPALPKLRQLCLGKRRVGGDLADAWLAAAALHLEAHLVSFDRDSGKLLARSHFTLLRSTQTG